MSLGLEERRDLLDGPVLGLWHHDLDVRDEHDVDHYEDEEDPAAQRQAQRLEEEPDQEVGEPVGDDGDGGGRGAARLREQLGHEEPAMRG